MRLIIFGLALMVVVSLARPGAKKAAEKTDKKTDKKGGKEQKHYIVQVALPVAVFQYTDLKGKKGKIPVAVHVSPKTKTSKSTMEIGINMMGGLPDYRKRPKPLFWVGKLPKDFKMFIKNMIFGGFAHEAKKMVKDMKIVKEKVLKKAKQNRKSKPIHNKATLKAIKKAMKHKKKVDKKKDDKKKVEI